MHYRRHYSAGNAENGRVSHSESEQDVDRASFRLGANKFLCTDWDLATTLGSEVHELGLPRPAQHAGSEGGGTRYRRAEARTLPDSLEQPTTCRKFEDLPRDLWGFCAVTPILSLLPKPRACFYLKQWFSGNKRLQFQQL